MRSDLSAASERGFTVLELIAAIGVLLLAVGLVAWIWGTYKSLDIQERNLCLIELDKVGAQAQTWAKTTTPSNPGGERSLCTTTKDMVEKYNKRCSDLIGGLPVPTCD